MREEGVEMDQTSQRREKRGYPGRRPPSPRPGGQKGRVLRRQRGGMASLSALSREARRRRMTYGALCQVLTEGERKQVIRAWQAEHPAPSGDPGACGGCVYWRDCSSTSPEMGRMCHFALDRGHMRRRDGGRCLEYCREGGEDLRKKPRGAAEFRVPAENAGRSSGGPSGSGKMGTSGGERGQMYTFGAQNC